MDNLMTIRDFSKKTGIPRQYITFLVNLFGLEVHRIKGTAGKGLTPAVQARVLELMERASTPAPVVGHQQSAWVKGWDVIGESWRYPEGGAGSEGGESGQLALGHPGGSYEEG